MDDHELGALLDAAVPAPPSSDAALARIHRRAGQRRRAAMAGGVLTVVVAGAIALGLSTLGGSPRPATPAGGTTSSSIPAGTTTIVPDGRCFSGDVSLSIDARSASFDQITQWAVTAVSRSDAPCRLIDPIKATIFDSNGHILTAVGGTLTAHILPTDPGYVTVLAPHTPTLVAQLAWALPCSNGPVELQVAGLSPSPAELKLPRQACTYAPISRSYFSISRVGDTVAGETCPFGSLTLMIDPHSVRTAGTVRWAVTATTRTGLLCRTHAGIEATIEKPDGTVLGVISGNPARQGNDVFQDLFRPSRPELVGYLTWSNPCSDTPVQLVARFEDGSYGRAARLNLPKQACVAGHLVTSHLQIDPGIPLTRVSGTTTTAKP